MSSFKIYMLRKAYQSVAKNGDRLAEAEPLIDWKRFTPIFQPMYNNQGPSGGRPNMDPVSMVKLLVLQAGYGLSDWSWRGRPTDIPLIHGPSRRPDPTAEPTRASASSPRRAREWISGYGPWPSTPLKGLHRRRRGPRLERLSAQ